jgi:hypothetical protein
MTAVHKWILTKYPGDGGFALSIRARRPLPILILLPLLLLNCFTAFGQTAAPGAAQEIIPLSSPFYEDMDALYLLTGSGTPSNARPWSKTEASLILSRIDGEKLQGPARALYQSISRIIQEGLRFQYDDGFQLGTTFDYAFEMYWHENTEDFVKDTDWNYGFEQRKPMLKLSISFALHDYFYIFTDMQYGRNRFTDRDVFLEVGGRDPRIPIGSIITDDSAEIVEHSAIYSTSFLTNILVPTYDLDFQTPKRAIAAVGGESWNFSLSRDKVSWGNGNSGNFIIDDHVDYHEFARFTAFSDYFKYDFLNVFFETNANTAEGSSADTTFRMFMAHRLEFRVKDIFTFAVSENIMYQNDVFSLRYLNPAFIYHNLNVNVMFNAIAHMEVDYQLAPKLSIYGQAVLDQAVAPNESASQADAYGYLAGLEHAAVIDRGILISSLEYAYANPALYRRAGMDFLMFRRYHGNGTSFISHIDYIGYQYGGDTQALQLDSSYRIPDLGAVRIMLLGLRKGSVDYFMTNEEVNAIRTPAPSGPEVGESLTASLSVDYRIPRIIAWIDSQLWMQLDWIGKRTYVKPTDTEEAFYKDHTRDIQFTVGMSVLL